MPYHNFPHFSDFHSSVKNMNLKHLFISLFLPFSEGRKCHNSKNPLRSEGCTWDLGGKALNHSFWPSVWDTFVQDDKILACYGASFRAIRISSHNFFFAIASFTFRNSQLYLSLFMTTFFFITGPEQSRTKLLRWQFISIKRIISHLAAVSFAATYCVRYPYVTNQK